MDAITALLERVSVPQLTGPDITDQQLNILIQSALRAADHAWLRPSRYLVIRAEARHALGELFLKATPNADQLADEKRQKILNMPLRAPLILGAVSRLSEHPRVPHDEQLWSTAAGVQNILNAAYAMGLGAIWRTGDMAVNRSVIQGLGVKEGERLLGFIYIGHVNCSPKQPPELNTQAFIQYWPENE